jgi:acetate kinase
VMATRSGTVDPGLVLWLQSQAGLSTKDVSDGLEKAGGLTALAGTADMREVEKGVGEGDERALLALEVYTHRLVRSIGSMIASAGGLDALVFTGGVGENSSLVRSQVTGRLGWAGVVVDGSLNASARTDLEISAERATARTFVVTAREDLQIAGEVRRLLT